MSIVTNTIFVFSYSEHDPEEMLRAVNTFFEGDTLGLVSIKDERLPNGWYGGSKFMEYNISLGAFNHLDLKGLVEHIGKINWLDREGVQLIVNGQEEIGFRIINFN